MKRTQGSRSSRDGHRSGRPLALSAPSARPGRMSYRPIAEWATPGEYRHVVDRPPMRKQRADRSRDGHGQAPSEAVPAPSPARGRLDAAKQAPASAASEMIKLANMDASGGAQVFDAGRGIAAGVEQLAGAADEPLVGGAGTWIVDVVKFGYKRVSRQAPPRGDR